MPRQRDGAKLMPSTYRFTPEEQALMDRLGEYLAQPGLQALPRIDVIRVALRRLADSELASTEGQPKKTQKNR